MGRMAMVIGTIGKAEVYFMGVILGRGGCFVNGGFLSHAPCEQKKEHHQEGCAEAPQVFIG